MPLLNPNLRGFYEAKGVRNYVLYGGRASSKTYHTAAFCVYLATQYRVKFLCVRQFQNRISDSVKSVIEECIYKLGLESQFHITERDISYPDTGSTFTFLGIQRNLKEIKGIANIDVLWIEEAEDLGPEQWKVLEPTIRAEGSRVFIVFNPRYASDFVYKRFVSKPPADTLVRKINYDENPYLSSTMRKLIDRHKEDDHEEYLHIYQGIPMDDDDAVVIKRSWVISAINAHDVVVPESGSWNGGVTVGYDVADDGGDKNATTSMDGSIAIGLDEWRGGENELRESAERVMLTARQMNAKQIGYDSIGVGAGTGSTLNSMGWTRHFKFNAGAAVHKPDSYYAETKIKNKDFFSNIKAQAWWLVADRLRNTYMAVNKGKKFAAEDMISISSECDPKLLEKLIDELTTPKRDFDNAGKVKVESKKDLANREVKSPNIADSFIIANSAGLCSSGRSYYDY